MYKKSIGLEIVLTIITCGIYGLFWMARISNETSRYLGEKEEGAIDVILSIITCSIYLFIWSYKMGAKIKKIQDMSGMNGTDNGLAYLLLSIFNLSIVSLGLMQNDFNKVLNEEVN